MRSATMLKVIVAAGLLLTVALIAATKSVNADRYKAVLVERVKNATGLDMTIEGPVKLRLALVPRLSITGLTLSVPGTAAPFLSVDRIEARVGLLPLLFHQIRTDQLRLIRPTLRLDPQIAPRATAAAAGLGIGSGDGVPATRFALNKVSLDDATIVWKGGADRPDTIIHLGQGWVHPEGISGGPMSFDAKGQWGATPFELNGVFGPGDPRRKARHPYPVQIKGTISGGVLVVRGGIADPLSGEGLDVQVDARGDELADLLTRTGLIAVHDNRPPPAIGPYKMSARIQGSIAAPTVHTIEAMVGRRDTLLVGVRGGITSPLSLAGLDLVVTAEADGLTGLARLFDLDISGSGVVHLGGRLTDMTGGWRLGQFRAAVGSSEITGELTFTNRPRPQLGGRLAAPSLAIADLGLGVPRVLEQSTAAPRPTIPIVGERIVPSTPLALGGLGLIDLDLDLTADRLPLGPVGLTGAAASIRLHDGRLVLAGLSARLGAGSLGGEAVVDISGRVPALSLHLTGSGLDLRRIDGGYPFEGGSADLAIDLRSQGNSPRLLADNLEGHVRAAVTDTRLAVLAAGEIPARLLGVLDTASRDEDPIPLRCGAIALTVKGGMIRADRGVAIETSRTGIVGTGTVDLRTESLNLLFAARGGASVRLHRGLWNPQIGEDGGPRGFGPRTPPPRVAVDAAPCRALIGRR